MPDCIPIFDCLTHPTLDGNWISGAAGITVEQLLSEMEANTVIRAFAVGMKGIGDYEVGAYVRLVASSGGKLIPIAWQDVDEQETDARTKETMSVLKQMGYAGIKLHPRFGRFSLKSEKLRKIIWLAHETGLVVLLCTYLHGRECAEFGTSFDDLHNLLADIPGDCRLVLLHGGTTRLLEVSEMTREHPRVLMDLSFTLCRYEGSSVDLDIAWLFHHYDRRICIGSDSPQYKLADLRRRFVHFAVGLPCENIMNIAHRNLDSLLEVQP